MIACGRQSNNVVYILYSTFETHINSTRTIKNEKINKKKEKKKEK